MDNSQTTNNKYIFTDSFKTKDILWEAYTGFIEAYHNYKMMKTLGREDPIDIATMNKYALYFFNEIKDFLQEFPLENVEQIKKIFEKDIIENEDFKVIREFFAQFMKVSGIKNIVKEAEDPNRSIEGNR